MLKRLVFILLFFTYIIVSGQDQRVVDSLESLLKTTRIDSIKAKVCIRIAEQYQDTKPKKAIEYSEKGLEIGTKLNHPRICGAAHLVIGYALYFIGDYIKGSDHIVRSIEFYEKAGDKRGVAFAYNHLGNLYFRQNNLQKAIDCFNTSIKIKEELGEGHVIAAQLNNLGVIYARMNRLDEAKKMFERSLKLERENNNLKGMAESYQCLANLCEKNESVGLKLYERALFIYDSLNEKASTINCLTAMADYSKNFERYKESIDFSKRALSLVNSMGMLYEKEIIYDDLSESYFKLKNYEESYHYSKLLLQLKDSIYNMELARTTLSIQEEYESEKKEKEIAVLEKQNAEISVLSQKRKSTIIIISLGLGLLLLLILLFLFHNKTTKKEREAEFAKNKAELEQKALRAQMNPHFLFNSLNSIQRLYIEGKHDLANDLMGDFSSLLRRILNNSGEDRISLKEEIGTLELYLDIEKLRCDGCFEYSINYNDELDLVNITVPPLIIQPFAENAIWHGVLPKKRNGKINISLKRLNDETLECIVEDNGVGFKQEKNSSHGSKGISMTEQRLGNPVQINSSQNGTSVKIYIPLN